MPVEIDPDLWRSASCRNMISHLTGPYAAGAINTRIAINSAGQAEVTWETREPLVLVMLSASLNMQRLKVEAKLMNLDGTSSPLLPLEFAPFTEAKASLPLYRPEAANDSTATTFTIIFTLTEFENGFNKSALGRNIAPSDIATRIETHLLEGVMGRVIYLLGAEKQRLRTQGREITAIKSLALARDNALDRLGSDLGIRRFVDNILYKKPGEGDSPAIFGKFNFGQLKFGAGRGSQVITQPRQEPDEEYRYRLAIYRPFLIPNRSKVLALLNGSGTSTDPATPNRGLPSKVGVTKPFTLQETNNTFSIAIHLVAAGNDVLRTNFLNYIRAVHLILPNRNSTTDAIHTARYLPKIQQGQINALRDRLNQSFSFAPDAAIAPALAKALDLLGRCRRVLGTTTSRQIFRAQDANSGSRYELGLGVDVAILDPTELNQLATQIQAPNRQKSDDSEIEAILAGITKSLQTGKLTLDPDGHWLLESCGIQTIHKTRDNRLYLSHLPISGMEITGLSSTAPGSPITLDVRYYASGDPENNFVLADELVNARREWTANGGTDWTLLTASEASAAWERAQLVPFVVKHVFESASLPAIQDPQALQTAINRLKETTPDLISTIRLPDSMSQPILAGQASDKGDLFRLIRLLRKYGLSSALPLITGPNEIVLTIGVTELPGAGINLAERQTAVFRWYSVPIYPSKLDREKQQPVKDAITPIGSRTSFTPGIPGLSAVVSVGYIRKGRADPYQFQVGLPEDAVLSLLQYEYLMNLLQHIHPLGIEVDTFDIRQYDVDLDSDGSAEPLPSGIYKTYRQFHRTRYRGESGITIESP